MEGLFCPKSVADPDLPIKGVEKEAGGAVIQNPEIRGRPSLKQIFQPEGPQFGLKTRGSSTENSIQKGKGLDLRVETPPKGEGSQIAFSLKQNHCIKTKSF